jgi:diacylglycerol kinase family enzyme
MNKFLCIYNPRAGGGKAAGQLEEVQSLFARFQMEVELCFTEYPRHAKQLVADANLQGYKGLLVAGGDGTFFEVLNGYMTQEHKPPLGIIPVG